MNRDTIISNDVTTTGLRVDATTDTSILWSSLISGPDYGAQFDGASVRIANSKFTTDVYVGIGSHYGLSAYGGGKLYIDECDFVNYHNGIVLDDSVDVVIDDCHFNSDVFDGDDDLLPAMNRAILGMPSEASCKVTRSCFDLTRTFGVKREASGPYFDLGTYPDSAENEFWQKDTTVGFQLYKFPGCAVFNDYSNTDTISATCNYWDNGSAVRGNIDASSPMTWRQPYCHETGGQGKLAEETVPDESLPLVFNVSQNYPNPFNPSTVIAFTLPEAGHARIEVFNILGRSVITLLDGWVTAGHHSAEWNGVDAAGHAVSSGVYLYRFESGDRVVSRKMLLMK